jgi:YesN/AraC family two-component response regulator
MRIDQAKEMLTNSSSEIKEIAYRLGFENTDYFFTVFRRLTGQTPMAYRNETQGKKL